MRNCRRCYPVVVAAAVGVSACYLVPPSPALAFAPPPSSLTPTTAFSSTLSSAAASSISRRRRRRRQCPSPPVVGEKDDNFPLPRRPPSSRSSTAVLALPLRLPPPLPDLRGAAPVRLAAPLAAFSFALVAALVLLPLLRRSLRHILWPGLYDSADGSFLPSNPLPPAADPECPFLGNFFSAMGGTKDYGAGGWYRSVSARMDHPSVMGTYLFGRPRALITGGRLIKDAFGREFEVGGPISLLGKIGASGKRLKSLLPPKSVLCEPDRTRHAAMRRLVGAALTPAEVGRAVPALRSAAEAQVDRLLDESSSSRDARGGITGGGVEMETVCKAFTLDVAWRQLLGLDLTEEEAPLFAEKVNTWINGLLTLRTATGIGLKSDPAYKAMQYLKSKIEEKIDDLEESGPDTSTLSGMVFSTDDDEDGGSSRKLTREEVIDNALILILAGSETSASTLTNASLLLGLHPEAWERLVDEQRDMMAELGEDALTRGSLDSDCPYLDAVVRETMRIRPLAVGAPRVATATTVVDGRQIPKDWSMAFNIVMTHELDPKVREADGSHMDVMRGFKPERWLDERTRPSDDFLPLGVGPRYCLGANLAYTEMKVFLAVLARRAELTLVQGGKYEEEGVEWKGRSIIPLPADGVPVVARARKLAAVV